MKPTGFLPFAFGRLAMLAVCGCAVGPDYHAPPPPRVAGYTPAPLPADTGAGAPQVFVSGADISGQWWELFRSPALNRLINIALVDNPGLGAAQQTLVAAEENVRAEQGSFLPSLSGDLQAERERISSAELANNGDTGVAGSAITIPPFTLYNASLSLSYSLDVFGGTRRQVESLAAQADYQRYELEAAYLSLTANIVTAAVTQASLNAQIDATNQIIATEQRQLDILNRQVQLGGVPAADAISEQATLASAQANLPPLESQLAQIRNQLADYVGALPADFHATDFTLDSLHLPQALPVSLPSALVAQRPDIQAAAAQLHTASANLGVAIANMLPQITLSASVGHDALDTRTLFTPQTLLWTLVAGVTQPIFEGGTLLARRKAAVATLRGAGLQYQATVLTAFQNVADTLQILQYDSATLAAAEVAADTSAKSLAVTQDQVQLGGQPFTAELTAQTTYQNAVIAKVKAQAARLSDTAALFQALGGGWWHRGDVTQSCCGLVP